MVDIPCKDILAQSGEIKPNNDLAELRVLKSALRRASEGYTGPTLNRAADLDEALAAFIKHAGTTAARIYKDILREKLDAFEAAA